MHRGISFVGVIIAAAIFFALGFIAARITTRCREPKVIYVNNYDTLYVPKVDTVTITVPVEVVKEKVVVSTEEKACIDRIEQKGARVEIGLKYYVPRIQSYVTRSIVVQPNDYFFVAAEANVWPRAAARVGAGRTFFRQRSSVAAFFGNDGLTLSVRVRL